MGESEGPGKKTYREAALCGAGFAALLAIRTLITPKPPFVGDPADLEAFFQVNQGLWLFTVFMTAGIIATGTWFYAGLRQRLAAVGQENLGTVSFGGWIMVGAIALIRHGLLALAGNPELARIPSLPLFVGLASVLLSMVWVGAFIASLALVIGGIRSNAFPQWFVGATAVFTILMLGGSATLMFSTGYLSPNSDFKVLLLWAYVAWAALGASALWNADQPAGGDHRPSSAPDDDGPGQG